MTIFLGTAPGVSAYFSSWDEYPRTVYRYSNEREMIHVNVGSTRPGSQSFNGTLAHELQHMVHWHLNPHDDTWLDEGLAELAAALAVPGHRPNTGTFRRQPDVQLTAWSQGSQTSAHYQAAYLFTRYLAQRFGEGAIAKLLAEPGRPPDTITASLSRSGYGVSFDDVFEDWLVANLLDDPAAGDGRYAHDDLEHHAAVGLTLSPDGQPADLTVRQYGAQYIDLQGTSADADLTFAGAPSVKLVGADATSGRALWWSNRADGLDSTLTRRFDLSGLTSATLAFNLWYDTERDFDFFYVMASTDGGTRWQILHGAHADDANPTGNAMGAGYSGKSGVRDSQRGDPTWIAETVDLTPFAGGEVLIRFAYVTDQGYNARGVLLDDVTIPEAGFLDDAEADTGWVAAGFLRSDNVIPQTWSVQLVEQRAGQTTVRPLRTDQTGRVVERLAGLGGGLERAVLVVSGLAPRTLEPAPFSVTLRPAPSP
jgi:immune inhibitor A